MVNRRPSFEAERAVFMVRSVVAIVAQGARQPLRSSRTRRMTSVPVEGARSAGGRPVTTQTRLGQP